MSYNPTLKTGELNLTNSAIVGFHIASPLDDASLSKTNRTVARSSFGNTLDIRRGGETAVKLSQDLITALGSLNVQASGFGKTDISDGVAEFGIIGGAADLDTAKVDILHDGGLTLTAGDTTVNLTDFIIDNLSDRAVLTGLVIVNGNLVTRAPLFDLTVGEIVPPAERGLALLQLENVAVNLTGDAAGVLNQVFGVDAFVAGFNIGTAESDILLRRTPQRSENGIFGRRFDTGNSSTHDSPLTGTFDIRRGGETKVALSSDLVDALGTLQVEAQGFGKTDISDGVAEFRIIGGAADVDDARVDILHDGGLTLKTANTTVNLTDFIIDNLGDRAVLNGLVTVNGNLVARAPLFDLSIGSVVPPTNRNHPVLQLENVQVTLTTEAASTLNQVFGVASFAAGFNIGTAESDVRLS